jgi:hypothetical protein
MIIIYLKKGGKKDNRIDRSMQENKRRKKK